MTQCLLPSAFSYRTGITVFFIALYFLGFASATAQAQEIITPQASCSGLANAPLTARRWTMIGLPCNPGASSTLNDVIGDDLGMANFNINWTGYERNEPTDTYFQQNLASPMAQTSGYWVKSIPAIAFDVDGTPTPLTPSPLCPYSPGCYPIPLTPPDVGQAFRYNMLGNPMAFSVPWEDVVFVASGVARSPSAAEVANIAAKTYWTYNGNTYLVFDDVTPGAAGTLNVYDGFWVRVLPGGTSHAGDLFLLIPGGPVDSPPQAVDDVATVVEDAAATTIDVLANDTDTDGGPKLVASTTQPVNGTVVITNAGQDLSYQPNTGYCNDGTTTDDFTYTLNDPINTTAAATTATVRVTVTCANDPPVLDGLEGGSVNEETLFSFNASATDPDVPSQNLTFSLSGAVPLGAGITSAGAFTFTPTEAQGPGDYTFDVVVTDDGTPNLSDSQSITITVIEVNRPPVLGAIGNQSIDELSLLTFTATATDPDLPANSLTFSLSGEPTGASITPAGVFTFTPTEAQGPGSYTFDVVVTDDGTPNMMDSETITVVVNEVNLPPELASIGNQAIDELSLLTFTATAMDADLPANGLSFSLSGEPTDASITPAGVFTFTPTEVQGPGAFTFDVIVTDDGSPVMSDMETITVTVNEVNSPPVLAAIGNQTIDELATLSFTAIAIDSDLPVNGLTFSLSGEPTGAAITPAGVFTFTPTEAQGPGSYTFDVIVTDDGSPALSDMETITVTVNEVNLPPVLALIGNQTVNKLAPLTFTAMATDPDLPANTLLFSLSGEPTGAGIDVSTGVFTFTPTIAQGPNLYTFDVIVTDNGSPALSDTEQIQITVTNTPPVITPGDFAVGLNAFMPEPITGTVGSFAVTDVDDIELESAMVALTNALPFNGFFAEENLGFDSGACTGLTVVPNATSPMPITALNITGTATLTVYDACLKSVTYEYSNEVTVADRVVEFVVNDGNIDSNVSTATITVLGFEPQ